MGSTWQPTGIAILKSNILLTCSRDILRLMKLELMGGDVVELGLKDFVLAAKVMTIF